MKKFKFSIDGNPFEATVNELDDNKLEVEVNGTSYKVKVDRAGTKALNVAASTLNAAAKSNPVLKSSAAPVAQQKPVATTSVKTLRSQLPGSIIKVLAEVGQNVNKGDVIMTIESMKMENNIMAETAGRITKIYVEPGKSVMQDDKLVDIEVSSTPTATPAPKPVAKPAPVAAPQPAAPAATTTATDGKPLRSPLPGSIIKILVNEGQAVKRGDVLLTMESMKMENEIKAEKDGTVVAIKVTTGQNVMQDEELLTMA